MRQLKNYRAGSESDPPKDKYDGMSEDMLLSELKRTVSVAKQNGDFSVDRLEEFAAFASPELDEPARKRLAELVEMIKNE